MKLLARLLLTLPFVLVTFLYLRLQLADNGCWGLLELIYTVVLWGFLAITFIVSSIATIRKRRSERLKPEPYSLIITICTLLTLIGGGLWGDNFKGSKWIEARSENYNARPTAQHLILRDNRSFTVFLREDDFTCYFSGDYQRMGDTIIFDNETIAKTNFKMTTRYLLHVNQVLPISDTVDINRYVKFDIVSIR